ncbi:PAS domain-containing protein [Candidatus Saccharibacteria bacterium]|nr:PAS domain-containing protein [Candidatus Saccharibacteria bacterium]
MSIFKRQKNQTGSNNDAILSELALKYIHDGVIIADKNNVICYINPAAVIMTGCSSADNAVGLDYGLIVKIESKEGRTLSDNENPLIQAMMTNQALDSFQASLIDNSSEKRMPVSINVIPAGGVSNNRIITLRNITKELAEEGEQTEFISTASHEMRTPVATIDGYLSLALNPQTATIDERARGYLSAAEKASKHLGKLFQDLLDVTKLDDGKIKPNFEPVDATELVKSIVADYEVRAKEAKLNLTFGSSEGGALGGLKMQPVVYGFVDTCFMREIMDNLIENAIKYTPEGGSIYVNIRGDGDRFLINVTDTGIGISADDLNHVFQKFYRADNSDTRTIGGTGLGLYLVKQRTEAMGGKVWAESAFGEGSTFYVSLPRLTNAEYEKRMIMVRNLIAQKQSVVSAPTPTAQSAFQIANAPNQAANIVTANPAPVNQMNLQPAATSTTTNPVPIQTSPAPPVQPPIPSSPPTPPVQPNQPTNIIPSQINNNLNGESK